MMNFCLRSIGILAITASAAFGQMSRETLDQTTEPYRFGFLMAEGSNYDTHILSGDRYLDVETYLDEIQAPLSEQKAGNFASVIIEDSDGNLRLTEDEARRRLRSVRALLDDSCVLGPPCNWPGVHEQVRENRNAIRNEKRLQLSTVISDVFGLERSTDILSELDQLSSDLPNTSGYEFAALWTMYREARDEDISPNFAELPQSLVEHKEFISGSRTPSEPGHTNARNDILPTSGDIWDTASVTSMSGLFYDLNPSIPSFETISRIRQKISRIGRSVETDLNIPTSLEAVEPAPSSMYNDVAVDEIAGVSSGLNAPSTEQPSRQIEQPNEISAAEIDAIYQSLPYLDREAQEDTLDRILQTGIRLGSFGKLKPWLTSTLADDLGVEPYPDLLTDFDAAVNAFHERHELYDYDRLEAFRYLRVGREFQFYLENYIPQRDAPENVVAEPEGPDQLAVEAETFSIDEMVQLNPSLNSPLTEQSSRQIEPPNDNLDEDISVNNADVLSPNRQDPFSAPNDNVSDLASLSDTPVSEGVEPDMPVRFSIERGVHQASGQLETNRDLNAPLPNVPDQFVNRAEERLSEFTENPSVKALFGFNDNFRFGPEVRIERFENFGPYERRSEVSNPFYRNMVNQDLNAACGYNGSSQSCVNTFNAATAVVTLNSNNHGSAAEWTGRTALRVADDLVELGGTQDQLNDVITTSVATVTFLENTLPSSTHIGSGKQSAAVDLVKASTRFFSLDTEENPLEVAENARSRLLAALVQIEDNIASAPINRHLIHPLRNLIETVADRRLNLDPESVVSNARDMMQSTNLADQVERQMRAAIDQYESSLSSFNNTSDELVVDDTVVEETFDDTVVEETFDDPDYFYDYY